MPHRKDFSGQKYGMLTFVEYSHNNKYGKACWKLHCDCGKEIIAAGCDITYLVRPSCGCIRFKDYTGQKYGKLIFVERISSIGRRTRWKLICDCGRELIATPDNVTGGKIQSCGCIRRHGAITFINGILDNYTRHARDRGFIFKLSRERVIELIHQPCFYCGDINSNTWTNKRTGEQYLYNGIDRFDSSKDYEEGNVVSCCVHCNRAKLDRHGIDFIEWAQKIVAHQDHKLEIDQTVNSLFQINNVIK